MCLTGQACFFFMWLLYEVLAGLLPYCAIAGSAMHRTVAQSHSRTVVQETANTTQDEGGVQSTCKGVCVLAFIAQQHVKARLPRPAPRLAASGRAAQLLSQHRG